MVEFVDRKGKDKNPRKKPAVMKKPQIQVKCQHCSHAFRVDAGLAGSEVPCPECAAPTPAEARKKAPPDAQEVQVATLKAPRKRGNLPTTPEKPSTNEPAATDDGAEREAEPEPPETSEGVDTPQPPEEIPATTQTPPVKKPAPKKSELKRKPKCPECGASIDKDDVICVNCGHDSRSEEPTTQPTMVATPEKRFPLIPVLAVCIILAGAAYYFLVMNDDSGGAASDPLPPPAEFENAGTTTPEPVPEPEPTPILEHVETPEPTPEPRVEGESESTEASPEVDVRQQIVDRLDSRQPLVKVGDTVQLAGQDNTVYRGKVIEINDATIRLYYRGSEGEVPIRTLSPRARSQVDPVFREQLIDSLAERYEDQSEE